MKRPRMLLRALIPAALLVWGPLGCDNEDDDDAPACTDVNLDVMGCAPAFQPTFQNVFDQVLQPSCGQGGDSCHAHAGAAGAGDGLVFADIDAAYDALMQRGRVSPGDPECSAMVVRLETDNASIRMPPGNVPLDAGARCSIEQWIAQGAKR